MNDRIIDLLNRLNTWPGAEIDRNVGQGLDAVRSHHQRRLGEDWTAAGEAQDIADRREALVHVQNVVMPYCLPDDYLFFLHWCGGLHIRQPAHHLVLFGVGPMVEEWYPYLLGDEALTDPTTDGVVHIGAVEFSEQPDGWCTRVEFFLELAAQSPTWAVVARESVVEPTGDPVADLRAFAATRMGGRLIANSFTEFLTRIEDTRAACGYTPRT